jgi:hypothetical protein
MRRFLLVLFAAALFAVLMFPTTAAATTWRVKNPSGVTMGKVSQVAKKKCVFYDKSGRRCGWVAYSDAYYWAYLSYPKDLEPRKYAYIYFINGYGGWTLNNSDAVVFGVARKERTKWVVRKGSRTMGRVGGACPGWAAAAAVFVLTKNWTAE